jgi:hypothetical protein
MEHAAFALAEYDALRITRGGLFLDTGHAEEVRDFALAFRTLPDRKFETIGSSTDPVALRTAVADGQRYVYMVNREYYPVRVQLKPSSGDRAVLTDTVGGQETAIEKTGEIVLGPYQLRTFVMPSGEGVEATGIAIPREIEEQLVARAREFLGQVEELRKKAAVPSGADRMAEGVRESVDKKWHARLRRQLTSYAATKTAQLAGTDR